MNSNHSVPEYKTLQNISSNSTITIKPSDKGGNIVILDNEQYITMCMNILNKVWHAPVTKSKIDKFEQEFYQLVVIAFQNNLISKNVWEFIRIPFPRTPTFYALPTLHKSMLHPSGRPIISGNGSLTQNLSKFIDSHLRPHMFNVPSYIRDTIHLVQNIDGLQVPSNAVLVAIDVEALYSSIPNDRGLACIQQV